MGHLWFGFFLAAIINLFHKLYIRMAWNRFLINRNQRNDVRQFALILYSIPGFALALLITWSLSWLTFDNTNGFWIFWTYVVLLCLIAMQEYDYLYPQNANMN